MAETARVIQRDESGNTVTWLAPGPDGEMHVHVRGSDGSLHSTPMPDVDERSVWNSMELVAESAGNRLARAGLEVGNMLGVSQDTLDEAYYPFAAAQAYREDRAPWVTAGGEMIPEIAGTAAFGNRGGLLRQLFAGSAAGGVETALDYDPDRGKVGQFIEGSTGALAGDVATRALFKGARGAGRFLRHVGRRAGGAIENLNTRELVDRGYVATRPSDYFDDSNPVKRTLENMEVSATSSLSPAFLAAADQRNKGHFARRVWNALTGGRWSADSISREDMLQVKKFLKADQRAINEEIGEVAMPEEVLEWLPGVKEFTKGNRINTFPTLRKYYDELGKYADDLKKWKAGDESIRFEPAPPELPDVPAKEWVELRSALTEEAAEAGSARAETLSQYIDLMDQELAATAGDPDLVQRAAELRERWQLWMAMNKRNVFKGDGTDVSAGNLQTRLEAQFGDKVLEEVPETWASPAVFDVMRDNTLLSRVRRLENTSATERASFVKMLANPSESAASVGNLMGLNLLMREGADPVGAINAGISGAIEAAPVAAGTVGRELGTAVGGEQMLDAALYPFVGDRDANQQ